MGQKFFDMHESSRLNMSFKCSGSFNIIYIMRIRIAEGEKQPPSVNQSYNQRPDLADAMSIPIVNSGTLVIFFVDSHFLYTFCLYFSVGQHFC